MNEFISFLNFLYYLFWPFIKFFIWAWPVLRHLRYLNPFLWWCFIFHKVKWSTISFMNPCGIGGGYDKSGWWCQKCNVLYCRRDPRKHRGVEQSGSS